MNAANKDWIPEYALVRGFLSSQSTSGIPVTATRPARRGFKYDAAGLYTG